MNRIYKVIWSKVKHQYVVVSELAHSNGKQSRTSRNSIRSRIAALVVCGAIAAFGVFSAVPNSAYAVAGGVATQSQYIAIATDSNSDDIANYGGYNYYKKSVSINGQTKYYYVREGYDISVVYGKRYAGADNSSAYIIDAKKNDQYNQSSDQGLLQAYQTTTSKGQITTLTGVNIEDLNTGVYGGASNAGGVDTPSDFGYHIKVNNLDGVFKLDKDGYIKVSNDLDGRGDWTIDAGEPGNTNFETYFSDKVTLENDGTYSYTHGNEKVTVPTNKVYSIGGKLGVFTDAKGNLYTGDVYGDNNEILLSAVGEGNQIYSYWGTKVNDPTQTIGNMTVQDYNSDRKKLQDQAAAYHGDDITNIAVKEATTGNGGTLSLNRVGRYNDQTGTYGTTAPVPGTITVTSTGGTDGSGVNNDVKIKFSNTDEDGTEHSFIVDAGSRVVGQVTRDGSEQDAGVDDANKTLTGLKINGVEYDLSQGKTYGNGDGINIDESTNKISVALAKDQNEKNVSGLHFENGELVNDFQVTNVDQAANSKPHSNGGNWTITKTDEDGESVNLTNTTLSSNVSKEAIEDNVAGSGYGNTYTISDTDGNTATLEDVASATKLEEVAGEAGKHTTVKLADGEENLTLDEGTNAEGGKEYTVALDKELNVTSVNAEGTTISAEGLKAGNVKVNAGNATITGLSNTTWDTEIASAVEANKNGEAGYAATQGQLQKVSEAANEGWTAYINGFETEVKDIHPGNDYFSFNEGDNISITKSEDGNGIVISSDLTNLDVDDTNAVIYDNEGKTSVTLAGSSGTTITNLKAGQISATSTDAVNGSQLYATNQNITNVESKVNAGWTLYSDGKEVKNVHPGNNYLNINSGDNVTIETTDNGITISSNDTTLDVANSTSTPIGIQTNQGKEIYGQSFKIADTAGNVVTISDIASAKKLIEVDGNVDTLDEFAVKYDKDNEDKVDYSNVTLGGETYTKTVDENGEATYEGGTALKNVAYAGNVVDENGEVIGSAAVNVDYLKDSAAGLIAENNNLKVAADNDGDRNLNNWTITDTNQTDAQGKPLTFSNTTLDVDNSTSTPIAVAIGKPEAEKYGQTFKIADTAGNVVTISDIASAKKLIEVDQAVQNAQTEAGKHTSVSAGDNNLSVMKDKTPNENGGINYQVSLKDDITLGNYTEGTGVVVSGSSGTISATNAISVGVDPNNKQKGIVISSGKSDSIVGLDNIEWKNDADWQKDNIQADRAATEGQLQQATSTLTTNERHIATNGGDNPEAPNNKYTVQADGTVSLTEVNGDGTPTKNTVVLDNVATKTQQDINTDKLTHIEHYAVDDEGNTEGKDYTQVEGTKLYNDGSISSTVKDGLGMSSDTLTFDESGLTVSKETMGNGSGSTNISGDTIKTVDEYGNETTIDGGSVTTEDLTVNTENGNKLTFDSTGLNVNSGDTGLSVNKDGISLSVDNGAGKNSSVKVTQDGTEFSYSENGIADATTTTIKGSTITTDTVTGLNNTKWDDVTKQSVADDTDRTGAASMAATQGQLADAIKQAGDSAAANDYRLVQNGTTADGKEVPYEINGNDQVELKVANSLGDDYTVTIDDVAKASELDTLTSQVDSGWTAKDSEGNVVEVNKENGHILNFYGDENINVTADKGAINIGLNPIVTLGDKNGSYIQLNSQPTDDDAMLTIVGPKDPVTGTHGEFAVGQDGTVHSTGDVIAYENGEDYSLGEIGDTVRHMMHVDTGEYAGNSHHYTVIGYNNEQDPIGGGFSLAVREDGAVAVGGKDGIKLNETPGTITGLQNTEWSAETGADDTTAKTAATQGQLNDLYNAVVSYDIGSNYGTVTLKGADYDSDTHKGGTVITNVAYSSGNGSDAVNVDYLNDAIADAVSDTGEGGQGGIIANSDKHLVANTAEGSNGVYKPDDKGNVDLIVADKNGNKETVTIGDVASKTELDNVQSQVNKNTSDIAGIKEDIGDLNYSNAVGTDVKDGDSVTDAIGKLDNKIDSIGGTATEADNNTVTGGTIKDDGTISLTQKDGGTVDFDKKVSDAYVSDAKFENNTLTISQTDKYGNDTYKDITVKNIASTDDVKKVETDYKAADKNITDTIGATSKNDLTTIYKDADKDGNTTTQYISQKGVGNMAQADVALDHAIQNVANTSYYNDTVLNNRINSVENRLGDVEERIDKVGAMAAAIANLRTMGYDPEAPTEIAVGVGQYKSETGLALGIFHYPNQDFMLSASISTSGDEVMGGIGATWKLGRKSAAEREKDNEERILAKAEEIKQAAKRAEVKAQADRHAQLLAEREAAGQSIRPVEEA